MLTYFLQVNVCWLLFYGAYYVLLSRETFFKLNRIYLIISLLCGLIIPIVVPKIDALMVQPLVEIVQPITVSVAQMQESFAVQTLETQAVPSIRENISTILMKLYSLGMAFFLLKFCWGLFTIFKLYRNGLKEKNNGFSLVFTEGVKTPFSFFNWIFLNQKTIEHADFQQIITHESAHVRQKHSFDILGLEILRGLFWLSPLVHFYARSLRNVHEYLADAAVLQNTQKQSYGRLLIRQTAAGGGLVLANHLNFSQLKKRITMMSRNPSNRLALTKYALVAPIFLLIMVFLASPKTQVLATTADLSEKLFTTVEEKLNSNNPLSETLNTNPQSDSTRKPPFDVVKNPIPDPMPRFAGMAHGTILREDFIKQSVLSLIQPLYSHTVICGVQSFQVFRTPFGKDNYQVGNNTGDKLNDNVLPIIQAAQNGDIYQFKNIKVRCPGDVAARSLGDLFFIIESDPNILVDPKVLNEDKPFICLPINSRVPITGGTIELRLLQANSGLIIKNNDKRQFSVEQYHVYKVSKTGQVSKEILNKGPGIYGEAEALILNAEVGDKIYFKNVLVHKLGQTEPQNWATLQFTLIENKDLSAQKKLWEEKKTIEGISQKMDMRSDCGMKEGDVGQMPVFQGGEAELEKFIYSNLRYPEEAKKAGREALFLINYVVNTDGKVSDVKSWNFKFANPRLGTSGQGMSKIEAEDKPLVDEAMRVVGSMPHWKPGTRNGVVAWHGKIILIKFQIEK
jgi:BlaR1 peptidase M56